MRRRTVILPIVSLIALLLGGGVVSAQQCLVGQNCNGTSGRDTLKGTIGDDDMYANGGAGTRYGYAGNDDLRGDG